MAAAWQTVCNWKASSGGSYASAGLVTGGEAGVQTAWRKRYGAGALEVATVEDMIIEPSLEIEVTGDTKTLLTSAIRASYPMGAITETLHLQIATETQGWVIGGAITTPSSTATCAINTMRLSWQEDDVLKAALGFVALKAARDTDGIAAVAATDSAVYGNGTIAVTLGGSTAMSVVGFDIGLNNNYRRRAPAIARGSNEKKFGGLLQRGQSDVEASFDVLVPAGIDLAADAPGHAIDASIVCSNGTTTITIALGDMGYTNEAFQLRGRDDGMVVWRLPFDCYSNALAIS